MNLTIRNRAAGRTRRGGFTLIEVMLVLIILVVLSGVSFFAYRSIQQNANRRTAAVQIEVFKGGVDMYLQENNVNPPNLEALWTPDVNNSNKEFIEPPKNGINADPWGNPYQFEALGPDEVRIWSLGPDGASGTEDDINSW